VRSVGNLLSILFNERLESLQVGRPGSGSAETYPSCTMPRVGAAYLLDGQVWELRQAQHLRVPGGLPEGAARGISVADLCRLITARAYVAVQRRMQGVMQLCGWLHLSAPVCVSCRAWAT
jgi:hypothetical protein